MLELLLSTHRQTQNKILQHHCLGNDGVETVSQAVTINVQNSTSEPLSFNGLANEFGCLENTSVDLVDVGALTAATMKPV